MTAIAADFLFARTGIFAELAAIFVIGGGDAPARLVRALCTLGF
jgi:hypothetical protein